MGKLSVIWDLLFRGGLSVEVNGRTVRTFGIVLLYRVTRITSIKRIMPRKYRNKIEMI